MNENINKPQNEDEVDLGQLFQAIGRMFKRLFDFIGAILYSVFLAFVWLVFFLKKNILWLGLATLLGLVFGIVQYKYSPPVFQSSALIKQNYPTGENLYSTIVYYNELVAAQDSVNLGQSLKLDPSEAAKIVGFGISSDFTDNEKLILYNEYIEEIDTSVVSATDFRNYVENLDDHDYEFQKIIIRFTDRGLFEKTLSQIVSNIESIGYYQRLQQKDLNELDRKKEMLMQSLRQSDSLQKVYQKVLQMNPDLRENQTSITIDRDAKESSTKEYQLYLNDIALRRELVITEREKEDLSSIIEVVSINQNSGTRYSQKSIWGYDLNSKYYYAVLFFFITLSVLLAMALLKFLERYKDKI